MSQARNNKAITVKALGKQYQIGRNVVHNTLRDSIVSYFSRIRSSVGQLLTFKQVESIATKKFWALRDISFDVSVGEVLGIIGANGAGKSTLLKILSRITEPTEGYVEIRGRVGSLLEVGTGFHQELTGRENIYLNGAILGMSRKEMNRKFDAIVDFSEIEEFLDTPVKHYSSGMRVRLGFAVAAYLEPEVLIVDEVLAVGDVAFQRKCIGKMEQVAGEGRTILFVSHNLASIQALCGRVIVLNQGGIVADTSVEDGIGKYLGLINRDSRSAINERSDREGGDEYRLIAVTIKCQSHDAEGSFVLGSPGKIEFKFNKPVPNGGIRCTVYTKIGEAVFNINSQQSITSDHVIDEPETLICEFDEVLLLPGSYYITVALVRGDQHLDLVRRAVEFEVIGGVLHGRAINQKSTYGVVAVPHRWFSQ